MEEIEEKKEGKNERETKKKKEGGLAVDVGYTK